MKYTSWSGFVALRLVIYNADCWYAGYEWFYDDEDGSDDDGDVGGKVFDGIYFHFYGSDHDDFIDAIMTRW